MIMAGALQIEDCLAVCQIFAGILGLLGHRCTAASTPLHEAADGRSPTSCNQHGHLSHDASPACADPLLRSVRMMIMSSRHRRWPSEVKYHPAGSPQREEGSSGAAPCTAAGPRTAHQAGKGVRARTPTIDWGRGMGL